MQAPARPIRFEDAVLVRQVQAGDLQAYAHLVSKYQDKVYNACCRICGNLEDARDITQEAFLKALESIGSFQAKSSFYTWLFRIAMNLALSERRKVIRRPTRSIDGPDEQGRTMAQRLGERTPHDPAGHIGAAELRIQVADALMGLDDDHRAAIVLRDIEGFNYADIAAILEIPVGTVKSRIARGRDALRKTLAPLVHADE